MADAGIACLGLAGLLRYGCTFFALKHPGCSSNGGVCNLGGCASTDESEGKPAKAVQQALTDKVGISRFKQRFFVEDGSHEIVDHEVFASAPLKVQLVLEYCPPDAEHSRKIISASRGKAAESQ